MGRCPGSGAFKRCPNLGYKDLCVPPSIPSVGELRDMISGLKDRAKWEQEVLTLRNAAPKLV